MSKKTKKKLAEKREKKQLAENLPCQVPDQHVKVCTCHGKPIMRHNDHHEG